MSIMVGYDSQTGYTSQPSEISVKTVLVDKLSDCDFCKQEGKNHPEPAEYDAKTMIGSWASMCEEHYQLYGVKPLGTGRGQRLILRGTKQPEILVSRADRLCTECGKGCAEDSWNKTVGRFRIVGNELSYIAMLENGLYCEEVGEG